MGVEVFLFFKQGSLVESYRVPEVGETLFEGVVDLSLGRGELPGGTKVFVFRPFKSALQVHDDSVLLLQLSAEFIIFDPVGFEEFLDLLGEVGGHF